MELDDTRTIHEEAFMSVHDGKQPSELGYNYFKMYGKWYIYGKSEEAVDAFVHYKKALREAWIFLAATFPFNLPLAIFGLCIGRPQLILLALILSFIFSSIVTMLCRNNEEYRRKFRGSVKVINKANWTIYEDR